MTRIKRFVDVVIENRREVMLMLSNLIKKGNKHIDDNGEFVFDEDNSPWVLYENGDGEIEDFKITSFDYDDRKGCFRFYYHGGCGEYITNDDCINCSENTVYEEFADVLEKELEGVLN